MTPAQTEQTQLIVASLPPLLTRSTVLASNASAAGAGIVPDNSILPRGFLAAPYSPSVHISTIPKLPLDALSASDGFILDEVVRNVHTTRCASPPPPRPDLSQPIVSDGTYYKRINLRTCFKSVKPFLRYVDRDFSDTSARTQFITGAYLVTPNDTTFEPTYCYRFYDQNA